MNEDLIKQLDKRRVKFTQTTKGIVTCEVSVELSDCSNHSAVLSATNLMELDIQQAERMSR